MLDELLIRYVDKFGKNFLLFCLRNMSEKEIISLIEECINDGIPYDVDDFDPNEALY